MAGAGDGRGEDEKSTKGRRKAAARQERAQRLAEALRENLRRRKDQARRKAAPAPGREPAGSED